MKKINKIGTRINDLWVLKEFVERKAYLCRCLLCGTLKEIKNQDLKACGTRSCGCLWYTHKGLSKHKLYSVWVGFVKRCYVEKSDNYAWYGAKGIRVCEEWLNPRYGYQDFYKWALDNGWQEGKSQAEQSLDRIDPNGSYSPNNCRWADSFTQANNKNNNVYVVYKGEKLTLSEAHRKYGKANSLYTTISRYSNFNWSIDDALEVPSRGKRPK